jgi:DNA-binding MarR family transcriptional regulator
MNDATDSALKQDSVLSLRLWLRLLSCTRLMENEIRGNLRDAFETTLPRFDVMAQLYRYPDGLRMGEISHLLMVTNGNITGIIDQLVNDGLVERATNPDDRRAYTVRLTAAGLQAFEAMAAQHQEWMHGLTDGLDEDEQQALLSLLTQLRDSLNEKLAKHDA